ncbi:hypothetical protein K2V61_12430 [Staphylococcus simulans]|uniref:hypothetical protein n=1 Tax=Staphylococcus simulans TaxID=1286 RepID=UPI001E458A64|nr:hypothetical protein [Staphylococcus simulans]MCD8916346.1 hypothetical protein [Staphylococcus simulans]
MKTINNLDPFIIVEERDTGKHVVEVSGSIKAVADFYDLSIKTYADSNKYKIYTNIQEGKEV